MKLKSLIIAVSLLVLPFAIQAQAPQSKPAKPAVENPWFISGGMGLSYATGSVGVGKHPQASWPLVSSSRQC